MRRYVDLALREAGDIKADIVIISDGEEQGTRVNEAISRASAEMAGIRSRAIPLFEALFAAFEAIDPARASIYHDFVRMALPAASRKLLEDLVSTTKNRYMSDWARQQHAEGMAEGAARSIIAVLKARAIEIPDEAHAKITACADLEQLDQWIKRAAVAERVEDLGGSLAE